MGTFDVIIMLAGGLLIIAGLVLFVSGKRETGKNDVEAFGIKVDVSNPSILLIALGVILLLVPRLLPDNSSDSSVNTTGEQTLGNNAHPGTVIRNQTVHSQAAEATAAEKPTPPSLPAPAAILLPSGHYELISYQENGIFANGIEGVMAMQPSGNNAVNWTAQLGGYNDFGQMMVYQYAGYIQKRGGNWVMMITGSTEPTYINQGETPLQLSLTEDEMTMQYQYLGSLITLAWEKTD